MGDRRSILLVMLAAMLWGTMGPAQAFAPASAHPVIIGAVRILIGGLAMVIYIFLFYRHKVIYKGWPLGWVLLAAAGISGFQLLYFSAVTLTGVAVGAVVAIGSAPILAGALEWGFRGKVSTKKWWAATSFAILGCLLLTTSGEEVAIAPLGILMAVGAGLSFATYTLSNKQLLEGREPEAVVVAIFTASTMLTCPFLLIYDLTWLGEPRGIGVALYLGIITIAFPHIIYTKGLTGISAATAVTLTLVEPLTAALLGVFLLGEALTFTAWLGVFLIFVGLLTVSYGGGKDRRVKRPCS